MKWLRNKLHNFIFPFSQESEREPSRKEIAISPHEGLSTEPLRLNIYRANGGTIVETRTYDHQKDRSQTQLHIVGNDEDLGYSLAKIITMESLRG